jgi:hypothetical protein
MYEGRSADPILAMKVRFAGAAVGVAGLAYFVAIIVYLAPSIFLSSSDPVAQAVDVRHDRWFGTQYEIHVGRGDYWCSGGDGHEAQRRRVPVAYDSQHPERCRAQALLHRLGIYEITAVLGAATFIAAGLGATVLWNNKKARLTSFAVAVLLAWGYIAVGLVIRGGSHG